MIGVTEMMNVGTVEAEAEVVVAVAITPAQGQEDIEVDLNSTLKIKFTLPDSAKESPIVISKKHSKGMVTSKRWT